MQIGVRIRELRKDKGWSQGQLCRQAGGLKREYLSRVENGHTTPTLATLERIAAALQISLSCLVDVPSEGVYPRQGEDSTAPGQVAQPQVAYQPLPQEVLREIESAAEEMCRQFKRRIRAIIQRGSS